MGLKDFFRYFILTRGKLGVIYREDFEVKRPVSSAMPISNPISRLRTHQDSCLKSVSSNTSSIADRLPQVCLQASFKHAFSNVSGILQASLKNINEKKYILFQFHVVSHKNSRFLGLEPRNIRSSNTKKQPLHQMRHFGEINYCFLIFKRFFKFFR